MKNGTLRIRFVGIACLVLLASAPSSCGSNDSQNQELHEEVRRQNTARLQAEEVARNAEESRKTWIVGLSGGACTVSLVALLIGVGIGSWAVQRYRKEHPRE